MTTLGALLLSALVGSAIGWVAGFGCATLRHHWQRASREGAPVRICDEMLPRLSPEDAARRGGI